MAGKMGGKSGTGDEKGKRTGRRKKSKTYRRRVEERKGKMR